MTAAAEPASTATQRMLRDAEDVLFAIAYETAQLLRTALESVDAPEEGSTGSG